MPRLQFSAVGVPASAGRGRPPEGGTPTRLQFSIRALLVLMAVVGAGIVVYRWPWTVTADTPMVTTTTQYRRGWNGKAVKHGRETKVYFDNLYVQTWFEEGELRRERTEYGDGMIIDKSVQGGVDDGPYLVSNLGVTVSGQYRQGKQVGTWRSESKDVHSTSRFENGIQHGPSQWMSPQGEIIQTTEYEAGELVRWNGKPVAEAVRDWMTASIPAADLRKKLLKTVTRDDDSSTSSTPLHYGQSIYFVGEGQHLDVQWDDDNPPMHVMLPSDRPIAENLLEFALSQDRTFAYRFGVLCLVSITPQQLTWRDRTGVADIRFEPGSEEEKYWLEPTAFSPWYPDNPAARLKYMFSDDDVPLEIDTTAIDDLEKPHDGLTGNTLPSLPRPRRDLIGLHLDREGYYCELRDGKLVIKPHPDSKRLRSGSG